MDIIFKKSDFRLCDVPVPKGYPQSQTHAGISVYNGEFFLTTSPYPAVRRKTIKTYLRAALNRLFGKVTADSYENPCIYVGVNDGSVPANRFSALTKNPLMETPYSYYGLPSYNSDPDIFIEKNNVYVLNRVVHRRPLKEGGFNYDCRLFLIKGKLLNGKYRYMGTSVLLDDVEFGSPSLIKYRDRYVLFSITSSCYNDGNNTFLMTKSYSDTVEGFNNNSNRESIEVDILGFTPWHMSVFAYEGVCYAVVACVKHGECRRCWQMLGVFNEDLSSLKIYKTPLTDYNSYRGSACVTENGDFVLYSTTVDENIKGSKSVDGRDVIVAHLPFVVLLERIKKAEVDG